MAEKHSYRMSSAGKCQKSLALERLGIEGKPKSAALEIAAREGQWHEERLKKELRDQGITVFDEQKEYTVESSAGFILVGHIDGKMTHPTLGGEVYLMEIKSMSQFQFDKWMKHGFSAFPHYAGQLACYFYAASLDSARYYVRNRSSGYLDERLLSAIDFPLTPIMQKLTHIEKLAQENKCAEAVYSPDNLECKECDYADLCKDNIEMRIASKKELDLAAAQWRQGHALELQSKELLDAGKATFREHSKASNDYNWHFDGLKIVLSPSIRKSYDAKVLEKLFTPEQLASALKTTPTERLLITDTRDESGEEEE